MNEDTFDRLMGDRNVYHTDPAGRILIWDGTFYQWYVVLDGQQEYTNVGQTQFLPRDTVRRYRDVTRRKVQP